MKEASSLGIRTKVVLACVSIGMILALSAVIAFFEFGRMSDYVSGLISNNITSVNLSRLMLNNTDEYNTYVLHAISEKFPDREKFAFRKNYSKEEFYGFLNDIYEHFTSREEKLLADTVARNYAAYISLLDNNSEVWDYEYEARKDWYFQILQPAFEKNREYLQKLTHITQASLTDNYNNIQDNYYRTVMPGVVAVIAGIILIFLFYYFLNFYILSPIVKMNRELKKYKDYNKSYGVDLHVDSGQLYQLNQNIVDIVEENKKLKKK